MISSIISRLVILIFGTLYPAYASYKAVRTKNLKEYVKWMMYWIVFALFTCTETFTDMFLSWFPFYYEVKIVLVLWLLSPATKGSSILYRKFVHPALCRREQEIDEYIAKAKDQGYHTVLNLGTKGVNYATTVIMQTAIKGGGGLVQQLRKSYSLSDLTDCESREERSADETDDVLAEPRLVRRAIKSAYAARRSASESNSRQQMYFPEVDVDVRSGRSSRNDEPDFGHIKSSEDISSGYSSADTSTAGVLPRAGSLRPRGRAPRAALTNIKRPPPAEESEVIIEELHETDTFEYANMPPLVNLPCPLLLSQTDPPFIYQRIGDQIRIVQVLANFPAFANMSNGYPDNRDQKETTANENKFNNETITKKDNKKDLSNETSNKSDLFKIKTVDQTEFIVGANETDNIKYNIEQEIISEHLSKDDIVLVDTTIDNTDADETDDEASFGTPDNSPRSKRTSKGRYGKGKAPPPPNVNNDDNRKSSVDCTPSTTSLESLTDIVNALPNIAFKESVATKTLQVINPIAEKKMRHKSRSPGKVSKASNSGIVKLLQLPGKLAFWNKNEESNFKSDTTSTSSNHSRRSSTIGITLIDEFQSCTDLNAILNEASEKENEVIFKDANDIADENIIAHHIMEKSDALKKIIEAKLESHPEYKFVSLHDDIISTTSKSTDV